MKHQESYQHYLETMARSSLRLMFCRRMDEKDRFWNFTLHSHDCLEIICFLEGSLNINLDTLASLAAVSPSYLERLFRRHLHTSPMRCLRQIRIQEAKKLLIQSAFSIEDIACRVGIPDASYFWRLFRKETGFSPSEYRRFLKNPEE